jgi:type II secretory pathway pseudopilin PulG
MTARHARSAFTLLELVLMLVFLAAAAAAGISWYFERTSVTLRNAAKLLVEDLKIAQQRSGFAADATRISFWNRGYRIANSSGILIPNPRTALPFERDYGRDAVFQGVSIEAVNFAGAKELTFDGRGLPSSAGEVRLTFEGARLAVLLDAAGFASLLELPAIEDQGPALAPQSAR